MQIDKMNSYVFINIYSPPTISNLRREQGGTPLQINWQARVEGAAQRHRKMYVCKI